jgi:FdhD protein
MMNRAKQGIAYTQFESGSWEQLEGEVIVEAPVSLTVNGEAWFAFMCTPVDLEAMAVGFLYNEGLLRSKDEIVDVRACASGDNVDVWLRHSIEKPEHGRRTSGCTGGFTSVESDSEEQGRLPVIYNGATLTPQQVCELINKLFEAQDLYRATGGVHTSVLSDGQSTLVRAEDIGRHNTLDKIAGRCLLDDIHPARRILITTGRISSEMLQKSARLGASVVISRTSPSSLSMQMAEKWGITLIGYARRNRFNIYTHPERITSGSAAGICIGEDAKSRQDP